MSSADSEAANKFAEHVKMRERRHLTACIIETFGPWRITWTVDRCNGFELAHPRSNQRRFGLKAQLIAQKGDLRRLEEWELLEHVVLAFGAPQEPLEGFPEDPSQPIFWGWDGVE